RARRRRKARGARTQGACAPGGYVRDRGRRDATLCSRSEGTRCEGGGCHLVRPLLWLPLGHRDGLPVELGLPVHPADERVLEEVLVVAIREVVRPGMRAAALLPPEPGNDHAVGELEQEPELERLREVAVEDLTLVVDDD